MKKVTLTNNQLEQILPHGFPHPSSTLLTGNSEVGKQAFEWAFVDSWLKAGGSVVVLLLQWPTVALFKEAMTKSTNLHLSRYEDHIMFVLFDAHQENCEQVDKYTAKANLLDPKTWNKVIDIAELQTKASSVGTLVVGAGLNLLLCSPTYSDLMLKSVTHTLRYEKSRSYLMSVSGVTKTQKISEWMEAVDNRIEINSKHAETVTVHVEKYLYPAEIGNQKTLSISNATFEVSRQLEDAYEHAKKQISRI